MKFAAKKKVNNEREGQNKPLIQLLFSYQQKKTVKLF